MIYGPSPIGPGDHTPPVRGAQRVPAQSAAVFELERAIALPPTPPAEVLDAIDTAARVLEELASKRLSLHFEYDDAHNKVRVQVTNAEGKVVRTVPPSELLDIAAGHSSVRAA
jgi:hypothetical protein